MVCRVSAAMIGATSMICATTIACGVNSMPQAPSGPERDSDRNTRQSDHHRRQPHQRVEDDDGGFAAGKADERDQGAEGEGGGVPLLVAG